MKFWHATDLHLDHLRDEIVDAFRDNVRDLVGNQPLLITGDITSRYKLKPHLSMLGEFNSYIVLGNHDFWGGSWNECRKIAHDVLQEKFLDESGPTMISDDVAIVGDSCWYDCRLGRPLESGVFMNDWNFISDYAGIAGMYGYVNTSRDGIVGMSARQAHDRNRILLAKMEQAALVCDKLIVLTHFPPWRETALYQDKPSHPDYLPFYTNASLGWDIVEFAKKHANIKIEVLCGHTHNEADVVIQENLRCHVGHAKYGQPEIREVNLFDF